MIEENQFVPLSYKSLLFRASFVIPKGKNAITFFYVTSYLGEYLTV